MTANQHESVGRAARYASHVSALAKAFKVRMNVDPGMLPDRAGAGHLLIDADKAFDQRRTVIKISPVTDETTYVVALHELGHCVHPLGRLREVHGGVTQRRTGQIGTLRDVRLMLDEEYAAWEWARQYALEWTPVMEALEVYCLNEYKKIARRLGVRI